VIFRDWVGDESIDEFKRSTNAIDLAPDELAERIVNEAAPMAAMEIVRMARHGIDDRIKFSAAKYLVDRSLDARALKLAGEQDELGKLLGNIQEEPAEQS
jgi:hypothetical protein